MSLVIYTVQDRVGYITLNRPEKRNALSGDMVTELKAAFVRAGEDETVKVIVLKANGEAFCAGADLAYLQQLQKFSLEENLLDSNHLKDLFQQIYQLKKGCGLATICDFVFSTPEAKFGYTEVKIGFIPALVSVFLIRKIGEQKAKQLLLSGDLIKGEEAVRMGLVNYLFAKEELEQRVNSFAQFLIKNNSGQSMALTKQMIGEVQSMPLSEALAHAVELNALARGSADCKKGIAAFLNKEEIVW